MSTVLFCFCCFSTQISRCADDIETTTLQWIDCTVQASKCHGILNIQRTLGCDSDKRLRPTTQRFYTAT